MVDVLIIGGGLAGWRAAEAVAASGRSVAVVANGVGNSPAIHALNCPVLPEDSVERYVADTLSSGRNGGDPTLVRAMCACSVALREEFEFDRNADGSFSVIRPVGSSVPRCVSINHAIGEIALQRICTRLFNHVEVIRGTVVGVAAGDGAFTARIEGISLAARALVIATGGWCGKYEFSTNPRYLQGDGIEFARALGAEIRDVDEEHVQYEPTVRIDGRMRGVPVITTLLHEGAVLRNRLGEEFVDGSANKDELSRAIFRELAEGRGTAPSTSHVQPLAGQTSGVWYDLSACDSESLRRCRMDPATRKILVAPAAHSSLGGIAIDAYCRALRADGRGTIPGLFACGEVTAGVHGFNRLGGNGGTAAMVFGRIAGESAAEFVNGNGG